jgi:hypothetical protein
MSLLNCEGKNWSHDLKERDPKIMTIHLGSIKMAQFFRIILEFNKQGLFMKLTTNYISMRKVNLRW